MKHVQAFNRKIDELIKGDKNSFYDTIRLVQKEFGHYKNYYDLLDSLSFSCGFGMIAEGHDDAETGETIGYIPKLKYYPSNRLDEEPRLENLGIIEPIELNECYEILAKACLYRMARIPNIIEKIKDL